jgi:DnaJ-class molecular chaperone
MKKTKARKKKDDRLSLDVECESCGGTGLWAGPFAQLHQYVVCVGCEGRGHYALRYRPFEGRLPRKTTKKTKIFRTRATGEHITYAQFKEEFPVA